MTAYGSYHLPDDTDPVQTVLDRLEGEGLEVLAAERNALSAVAVMGHLSALEHLIHRAMLVGSPAGQAAAARRLVRERDAAADAEARFHAATALSWDRTYRLDSDGAGYTHLPCGRHFGQFVTSLQLTDHRAAHHQSCEEVRDV